MKMQTKMKQLLVRSRLSRILALSLLVVSCTDGGPPTAVDDLGPQATVTVIYEAGAGGQFAFLQPLVKGEAQGAFATGLEPVIEVCNVTSLPATDCIELEAEEQDGYYQANWRDRTADPNETYSIEIFTAVGLQIGALELLLDGEQGDRAGRTFPIQFWVGQGLGDAVEATEDCVGDDRCNADYVPPPSSPTNPPLVITTENEAGATMAQLTFPAASIPPGGIVVILDCRVGGFDPGEGPLPTLLNQWPLFCTVTVTNPDGTPFTGELPSDASIDVCVVDETLAGQPPYHGFDHDDLLLGKSNGALNFALLPPFPTQLTACDGNTTIPPAEAGLGNRILRELDSRFGPAFGILMPEGLRAAPMYFRDGGVGGLVRSFSDINPVEPAFIEGTITHPGASTHLSAPLEGITVTLSGDADDVATTDANGFYSFGPLGADAPSGSDYTVTVSGLPAGEALSDPDIDVLVTGSGTTTLDFETQLAEGFYFYGAETGNYYTSFSTPVPWATANSNAEGLPDFRTCDAQLVSILSAGEDAFIVDNMPQAAQGASSTPPLGGYWLGGFQPDGSVEPAEGWQWVSGEAIPAPGSEFGYENWASGEPNNSGGVENHLHYLGDWNPALNDQWNDEPGTRAYGYVVEYVCPGIIEIG